MYQSLTPRSFGADERPLCPNCKRRMSLTRRSPDIDHNHERQSFACRTCEHEIERVVDIDGNPLTIAGSLS
jgi:hypothetical protein